MNHSHDPIWRDALRGLERGDFSRLEPLFDTDAGLSDAGLTDPALKEAALEDPSSDHVECQMIEWHQKGYFDNEPKALAEALTCACFLGRTGVAEFLLNKGVDPGVGIGTGLSAFHWAANRGNLDTVKLLIEGRAPLEQINMYGGTVLGCAVWSAINEPRANHLAIIEALLAAGADIEEAGYPTGDERVDEVLSRHGARS
jgi:Ankyrin repeats (3 copies)